MGRGLINPELVPPRGMDVGRYLRVNPETRADVCRWRIPLTHRTASLLATALLATTLTGAAGATEADPHAAARTRTPVVLTGKQLSAFSAPAPIPARVLYTDTENTAEITPPDASTDGANVTTASLTVYANRGGAATEIPSQVDERFWRYLANEGGENGPYSGFDPELTYVFDEEGFRKTAGECYAEYPAGPITTPDPIANFDDDDEIVFMARDAGARLSVPPAGSIEVGITDPVTSTTSYVYVTSEPGRAHDFGAPYVSYARDPYADRYINARSGQGIPSGARCSGSDPSPVVTSIGARRPRDTATFSSAQYTFHWGGRWKPDQIRIDGGVDLIDQWKGRAFQQTREQAVSVGFIGEVAWEETSVTLGERVGPIRALRETWGAKSGTNVTRLYTLYDGLFVDTFNLRVHPIPPDGIYSSWDHNAGSVTRYYSSAVPDGVPIDGVNDEVFGNLDIGVGTPAESHYDIADPTVQAFTPVENWEEVAGDQGSIVYYLKNPRPGPGVITSYYRDDAEFDDGSGDNPVAKQGAFGTHGVHFYATGDTDNLPVGFAADELVVTQSQYMLSGDAGNVGEAFAQAERLPLRISIGDSIL